MAISYLEMQFERVIARQQLPEPVREYKFKRWRFDFAWPKLKVAVEIDGGTFAGTKLPGNHAIGKRYQKDCIKNNAAQLEGWAVLRADREMVGTEEFGAVVRKMLLTRVSEWRQRTARPQ